MKLYICKILVQLGDFIIRRFLFTIRCFAYLAVCLYRVFFLQGVCGDRIKDKIMLLRLNTILYPIHSLSLKRKNNKTLLPNTKQYARMVHIPYPRLLSKIGQQTLSMFQRVHSVLFKLSAQSRHGGVFMSIGVKLCFVRF